MNRSNMSSTINAMQALLVGLLGLGTNLLGQGRVVAVVAALVGLASSSSVRVLRSYRRCPAWTGLPRHHHIAVVLVDVLSGAALGPMIDSFLGRATNGPRTNHIDATLAAVAANDSELRRAGGYANIKQALVGFGRLHLHIGRDHIAGWAIHVCPIAFPVIVLLGGVVAAVHLGTEAVSGARGAFLVILGSASGSLFLAGVGHLAARPGLHQAAMTSAGVMLLVLSFYLWHTDTSFVSGLPDLLGRLLGVSFGTSILAWQYCARTDQEGLRGYCRAAAAVTAALGIALSSLNVLDRVLAPPVDLKGVASFVWPLCIVLGATLAALSPPEWGTGSRSGAVAPREGGIRDDAA